MARRCTGALQQGLQVVAVCSSKSRLIGLLVIFAEVRWFGYFWRLQATPGHGVNTILHLGRGKRGSGSLYECLKQSASVGSRNEIAGNEKWHEKMYIIIKNVYCYLVIHCRPR